MIGDVLLLTPGFDPSQWFCGHGPIGVPRSVSSRDVRELWMGHRPLWRRAVREFVCDDVCGGPTLFSQAAGQRLLYVDKPLRIDCHDLAAEIRERVEEKA